MNAIVILAAGASTRFGSPKQNLTYHPNESLLQNAIRHALTVSDTVLVVLGANRESIEFSIKDQPVTILYNPEWAEGMASSVRLAVEKLRTDFLQVSSALFMLCDQPYADADLLLKIVNAAQNDKGIIASHYNDTLGAPVLFKAKYFPYLIALRGAGGARNLIQQHHDDVEAIDFPLGEVDIDTPEDWERFR